MEHELLIQSCLIVSYPLFSSVILSHPALISDPFPTSLLLSSAVLSCPVPSELYHPVASCPILLQPLLSYPILLYPILSCFILSCLSYPAYPILSCFYYPALSSVISDLCIPLPLPCYTPLPSSIL